MDVQIGQNMVQLDWLAGAFVVGSLLGLFVGIWAWRLQWKSRRQAFEWLLEERNRNVKIAEENTNLKFIYQDRDRWRGIYEASLEAQGRLSQELGERNAKVAELAQEGETLRGKVDALDKALDALRKDLGAREVRISEIEARNEMLSRQSEADAERADGLKAELARANGLLAERGEESARLFELVDRRTTEAAGALEKVAAKIQGEIDKRTGELGKVTQSARDTLLSDMSGWFKEATANLEEVEKAIRAEIGQRTDTIVESAGALKTDVLSNLSEGFAAASSELGSMDKALRSEVKAQADNLAKGAQEAKKSLSSSMADGFKKSQALNREIEKSLSSDLSEEFKKLQAFNREIEKSLSSGLSEEFKKLQSLSREMEKSIREDLVRQTAELGQDVDGFKEIALSESRDAARAEYEARIAQLELASNTVVRKLSDQTQSILSSPQFVDFISAAGAENDVPTNLTARVTTARVMRATGRLSEAVELLESCRSEDAHSRTVLFDLIDSYIEIRRFEDARSLINSVSADTLETEAFRARHTSLRRRLAPGVFLCALPKSAGVFIYNSLATGLDKALIHTGGGGYFPHMAIPQGAPDLVGVSGAIYHTHAEASRSNIIEVNKRLDRLVLHLRDPRGALLSWTHFIARVVRDVDPVQRLHYGLPDDIEDWTFAKQLAWQVDNFLPVFVSWTEGWLAAIDEGDVEVPVLVTTYEDLVEDQDGFFDKLLEFSSIDDELFDYPARPSEGFLNFRKGDPLEWERVFPARVKKRAREIVPEDLRDRFGWKA